MPRKVRWMLTPEASVKIGVEVESDLKCHLHMRVLSQAVPQRLEVLLNGVTILEKTIDSFNTWHSLKTGPVKLRTGENILEFKASAFKRYPNSARDLYVLFDALSFQRE